MSDESAKSHEDSHSHQYSESKEYSHSHEDDNEEQPPEVADGLSKKEHPSKASDHLSNDDSLSKYSQSNEEDSQPRKPFRLVLKDLRKRKDELTETTDVRIDLTNATTDDQQDNSEFSTVNGGKQSNRERSTTVENNSKLSTVNGGKQSNRERSTTVENNSELSTVNGGKQSNRERSTTVENNSEFSTINGGKQSNRERSTTVENNSEFSTANGGKQSNRERSTTVENNSKLSTVNGGKQSNRERSTTVENNDRDSLATDVIKKIVERYEECQLNNPSDENALVPCMQRTQLPNGHNTVTGFQNFPANIRYVPKCEADEPVKYNINLSANGLFPQPGSHADKCEQLKQKMEHEKLERKANEAETELERVTYKLKLYQIKYGLDISIDRKVESACASGRRGDPPLKSERLFHSLLQSYSEELETKERTIQSLVEENKSLFDQNLQLTKFSETLTLQTEADSYLKRSINDATSQALQEAIASVKRMQNHKDWK